MFKEVSEVTLKYPALFWKHFRRAFTGTTFSGLRGSVELSVPEEKRKEQVTLTAEHMSSEKITQIAMFEDLLEGMTPNDFYKKWRVQPQDAMPLAYCIYGLYPEVRVGMWRFMGAISPEMEDLDAVRLTYHLVRFENHCIPVVDNPVLFLSLSVILDSQVFALPAGQPALSNPDYAEFVRVHGVPRLPSLNTTAWSDHLCAGAEVEIPLLKKIDRPVFPAT